MYSNMISTHRDMFAVCAVAVFCLMSVSHSAPLACEDLARPLDRLDPRHLEGRWALVAGGLENAAHLEYLTGRDSSSMDFPDANVTSIIIYTRVGGKCKSEHHNVSLEGSVLTINVRDRVNVTVTFLYTSCPDCAVMRFELKKPLHVLLLSRRREVEQEEMEEFKAQVDCLNMFPPAVLDPTKELCPERSASDAAAARTEG